MIDLSFKRKPLMSEVSQYVQDLERITVLRDKTVSKTEQARYDGIIQVMQLVLKEIAGK